MPTRARPSSDLQTLISSIDSGPFALPLLRSVSRFDPGTINTSSTSSPFTLIYGFTLLFSFSF
ncbi:hypothetical protein DY000_02005421 [Brassica cretica]|uniref:Uncharacterized protein n=1 Tax=Brassica cretica TaxID=69181 RepID=A0ABQ7C769_BRACR|nr:hypothetical protein DY000_02005421 [Brassica cretica]